MTVEGFDGAPFAECGVTSSRIEWVSLPPSLCDTSLDPKEAGKMFSLPLLRGGKRLSCRGGHCSSVSVPPLDFLNKIS